MCTVSGQERTPVEAYWHAVAEVLEWADEYGEAQRVVVVQEPLVVPDPEFRAA
jgi:hypothetical protein